MDGWRRPDAPGRSATASSVATPRYRVDPEATRLAIACDDVQKIRDAYLLNPATPAIELNPGASNRMPAARTRRQLLQTVWPNAQWLP